MTRLVVIPGRARCSSGRRCAAPALATLRATILVLLCACGPKPVQTAECDRYENCVIAISPWLTRNVHGQYGREGTCWASNQATADACTMVCIEELGKLQATDAGMSLEQCR